MIHFILFLGSNANTTFLWYVQKMNSNKYVSEADKVPAVCQWNWLSPARDRISSIIKAFIFYMLYKAPNSFAKKHNVNIFKNFED